jgi:hypothetical protein
MLISDELRKNIAFIGFNNDGEPDWRGTAFLAAIPSARQGEAYHYLITAKHVIELISKHTKDGKVLLRMNHVADVAHTYTTDLSDWVFHPDNSSIDVAVVPIRLGPKIELMSLPTHEFRGALPNWIQPGTQVFFPGLFYRQSGERRNLPIVRTGAIAAMPEERLFLRTVGYVDVYLVEARSIGGLSGSPVFAYREFYVGTEIRWEVHWLGLMHGHFDELGPDPEDLTRRSERVNMGLAIVFPTRDVLAVLDQPRFKDLRLREGARA